MNSLPGNRILYGIFLILLASCGDQNDQDNIQSEVDSDPVVSRITAVEGIRPDQRLTIGDTIALQVAIEGEADLDSVKVLFAGREQMFDNAQFEFIASEVLPGKQTINLEVFLSEKTEKHSVLVEMLSEIVPEELTYQRVTYYTHDPDAYTQGLFYHNGFLYENTGKKGSSSLRKIEMTTGKVLQQSFLEDQYFGEGITLWQDQIIQLTWTSNQGFVYDLETFEQIRTFTYPTEGWGITTVGDRLVMSDGTENLYFLDPESLMETHRLKVYDNKGTVGNLNELEFVEEAIYANVYNTDHIAVIDPATGKVLKRIDLSDLLNAQWGRPLDVLNGIAYDNDAKRLFVTGKLWPRLYEIRVVPKDPS